MLKSVVRFSGICYRCLSRKMLDSSSPVFMPHMLGKKSPPMSHMAYFIPEMIGLLYVISGLLLLVFELYVIQDEIQQCTSHATSYIVR